MTYYGLPSAASSRARDLEFLGVVTHDLLELDMDFFREEVWKVIQKLPMDKCPARMASLADSMPPVGL